MAHRRLIIRERITAIAGAAILCVLVAGSYYYSVRSQMAGLKYVPSESSPDFMAENVALTDFNEVGQPPKTSSTSPTSACTRSRPATSRLSPTELR